MKAMPCWIGKRTTRSSRCTRRSSTKPSHHPWFPHTCMAAPKTLASSFPSALAVSTSSTTLLQLLQSFNFARISLAASDLPGDIPGALGQLRKRLCWSLRPVNALYESLGRLSILRRRPSGICSGRLWLRMHTRPSTTAVALWDRLQTHGLGAVDCCGTTDAAVKWRMGAVAAGSMAVGVEPQGYGSKRLAKHMMRHDVTFKEVFSKL